MIAGRPHRLLQALPEEACRYLARRVWARRDMIRDGVGPKAAGDAQQAMG